MKHKMSISIDGDLISKIRIEMGRNRLFRSKSHVIEEALLRFFEGGDN